MGFIKEKWNKVPLTVKVSTAYATCSILQRCISFITLPIFTNLLTTEQYGQLVVYSSWTGILSIFLTLNLGYGSFSTAMVKFEDRRSEYITSIQGICFLLTCLFLMVYIPFRTLWNKLFKMPTGFVLLLVAEIFFSTATQLWMGKNRFEFKYKSVVAVTLLTSILSPTLAYYLVMHTEEKGYARVYAYAGVNIAIGFFISIVLGYKGKKYFNKEFWKYAFGFNVPLLAYYLSQVIFNQSDHIMIDHLQGTSYAALYGLAYNFAMILNFVLNAINGSYVPWLYGRIKEGKGEENKPISIILTVLMALMILCIIWYAPEIILLMSREEYLGGLYVIAPVSMSLLLLFYCQFFINIEFYYEEKKMLVYGSIGSAVLNIVLNYLLIPRYGFVAAGYTTLVSYIAFAVANYFTMKAVLKKRNIEDNLYDYKALVIIFILFAASGFLGVALYGNLTARIIITLIVLGIMIIFRNKFFDALKRIKES